MAKTEWTKVLVAISDLQRTRHAVLDKAAALAQMSGTRLTLFNAFLVPQLASDPSPITSEEILKAEIVKRRARLEQLAKPLLARGIKVECIVEWDYPIHEAIIRCALRIKPDAVFAESHRHGRIARWLLANTDWELIRNCPYPLWFVKTPAFTAKAPAILVAVDPRHTHAKPAELDNCLLEVAKQVGKQIDGKISVAHAFAQPSLLTATVDVRVSSSRSKDRGSFAESTRADVKHLAAKYAIGTARQFVRQGDVAAVMCELTAELQTDVLVLGAVSRSRLQQPFIGNTAEKIIDQVGCDVLIVKPTEFKTTIAKRTGLHLPKISRRASATR